MNNKHAAALARLSFECYIPFTVFPINKFVIHEFRKPINDTNRSAMMVIQKRCNMYWLDNINSRSLGDVFLSRSEI